MQDESELPPVYEGLLDASGLEMLFGDLAALDSVVEVSVKQGPARHGEGAPGLTLAQARDVLAHGQVRAVQLRYTHHGQGWCDTLVVVPGGTRIVRMELPSVR